MRTAQRKVFPWLWAVAALTLLPASGHGQDAADIMRRALAAQADRLGNITDVTLIQSVVGMETTVYMEKRELAGTPVLVPVTVIMGGITNSVPEEMAQADWSNPFQEEWVERTRLDGTGELDGRPVLFFVIDDFTGLDLPSIPGEAGASQNLQPSLFRYALGEEDLLMRKAEMEGEAVQQDGTAVPVRMTMFLEDYREVDGYLHPYVTRVISEGVMEAANVDREELAAQIKAMREQLANMPEAQRAMMERMLGPQIEQLEEMLGGEGPMEVTITVKEMKVNAGPPGGGV